MGGLRSHRRIVIGVLAAATVLLLALGSEGTTIANVLALPVAVAALLVALVEARARSVNDDRLLATARQLAPVSGLVGS